MNEFLFLLFCLEMKIELKEKKKKKKNPEKKGCLPRLLSRAADADFILWPPNPPTVQSAKHMFSAFTTIFLPLLVLIFNRTKCVDDVLIVCAPYHG